MNHSARLRNLQKELSTNRLDSLLVTHLPNIRYLCGFTGSSAALLVSPEKATLFTDGRYRTQAKDEVSNARIVIGKKAPAVMAVHSLAAPRRSGSRFVLGIEPESLTAGARDRLAALLRGKIRMRPAAPLVERARMVKDAGELRLIRNVIELGASLFHVVRRTIKPGTTELEVAAAMEFQARSHGAEGMSFSTIIAAGPRSAVVHGRASQSPIPRNGFVVCDFGVILAGYCSDRTRTVHVGRPSAEARRLYDAVLEAQLAAIDAVKPGVKASEVDHAARSVLRKAKLAQYFTHSTGHGLGLEIHEAPRIAAGQEQTLEAGMVITIEPGAYVPGKWGVRIEDVVVVTGSGCEVLTPTEKELVVI